MTLCVRCVLSAPKSSTLEVRNGQPPTIELSICGLVVGWVTTKEDHPLKKRTDSQSYVIYRIHELLDMNIA